jgi:membrane-associated phospholipid phosphatase
MNRRQILYCFLAALVLTLLSIVLLDQPVAAFVQRSGGRDSTVLQQGTRWLEIASVFPIARHFLTYLLLAASALLFISKSSRPVAWMLLFVATAHVASRLAAGALKNVFERLRPFEVIQAGNWDWKFFSGHGNAFPSGHSAHFWGLFFPLAFLFPRYRIPLVIIPLFISVARPGVNDHWCSDVLASIALAALITLIFIWLFRMKEPLRNSRMKPAPHAGALAALAVMSWLMAANVFAEKEKTAPDYFPLRVGDSWTYRNTEEGGYTLKVLSEEPQEGGAVRYVVELRSGVVIQNVYSKAVGWVLFHAENYPEHEGLKASYDPPKQYLPNPLVAGQKWEWTGKDPTQVERRESHRVVGFEYIKVPAGKFRAMKVISEVGAGAIPMIRTDWYAVDVGLVKSTTVGGQIKYGSELTDYSFKKKPK